MTEVTLPITVFEDNMSCIHLATGEKVKSRSKHIDVKYHYVRDQVKENAVKIDHMPSERMLADLLTKPLSAARTAELKRGLLICSTGPRPQREARPPTSEEDDSDEKTWDQGLAIKFWTRLTRPSKRTSDKDIVTLISDSDTDGEVEADAESATAPRKASPLNTPLVENFSTKDATPTQNRNSGTGEMQPGSIQSRIGVRRDGTKNSFENMPRTTLNLKRKADHQIDWNLPRKRACIRQWMINKTIKNMVGTDYDAIPETGLNDQEKGVLHEVQDEVQAARDWLLLNPTNPGNVEKPIQRRGSGRQRFARRLATEVVADAADATYLSTLAPEEFVENILTEFRGQGSLTSLMGSGLGAGNDDEESDDDGMEQLIAAGMQGTTQDQAQVAEEPDEGTLSLTDGDDISLSQQQESMGDNPVFYLGRKKIQGTSMWILGIKEANDLALQENATLRRRLEELEEQKAELEERLTLFEDIDQALGLKGYSRDKMLEIITYYDEGGHATGGAQAKTPRQEAVFDMISNEARLIEGREPIAYKKWQAKTSRMHDKLVPLAADGNENPKKEHFVNSAANTLEAVMMY